MTLIKGRFLRHPYFTSKPEFDCDYEGMGTTQMIRDIMSRRSQRLSSNSKIHTLALFNCLIYSEK